MVNFQRPLIYSERHKSFPIYSRRKWGIINVLDYSAFYIWLNYLIRSIFHNIRKQNNLFFYSLFTAFIIGLDRYRRKILLISIENKVQRIFANLVKTGENIYYCTYFSNSYFIAQHLILPTLPDLIILFHTSNIMPFSSKWKTINLFFPSKPRNKISKPVFWHSFRNIFF